MCLVQAERYIHGVDLHGNSARRLPLYQVFASASVTEHKEAAVSVNVSLNGVNTPYREDTEQSLLTFTLTNAIRCSRFIFISVDIDLEKPGVRMRIINVYQQTAYKIYQS